MPRIITVDPTGSIARIVRSAMDLLELSIIQVDVPSGADGLEELVRGADLVVSAYQLEKNMRGFEFALRVKKSLPDAAVLLLGGEDDPQDLDEETTLSSPFVYMSRPVNIHQFLRVLVSGLDSHEAMIEALHAPEGFAAGPALEDMGPVPDVKDLSAVERVTEALLRDLGALGIIFATRTGEALVQHGAIGEIERDELTKSLIPMMKTNMNVKELLGGQVTTIQFYDGDNYDIYVLSVGLHHLLCITYDGQHGSKSFGAVNSFGRRAVQDLIANLGADAFFLQPPVVKREEPARRTKPVKQVEPEEPIELAPAEFESEPEPEPESVIAQLEPIQDLDLDDLFGSDVQLDDDFFDLENVEEIAKSSQQDNKSALDWDQAQQLGILKG